MLHNIFLEKTPLKNTGSYIYFVSEYKAGEFGIFNQNNQLVADCFESFEHAQSWYNSFVASRKKLKVLNNKIFETIE